MSWAAVVSHVATSYMDINNAYEQSKLVDINAKLRTTLAGIEADQMMRQATMAENIGVRQSQIEQYKTRATMSDATAQMAASGAVLDPEMLAKIKQRGDYNALSALFDARTRAIDMRYKAGMHRIGAAWDAAEMKRQADLKVSDAWTGVALNTLDKFWPRTSSQTPDSTKLWDTKQQPLVAQWSSGNKRKPVSGASFTRVPGTKRGFVGGF